ncbi:hypothetical protein B0G62_1294 [Paraburkholderia eburnea]|uniref:DDE family transposase n=1 Tax=Paraburkholderia eburnea TaxID=1189126 RepID=A0A2S4LTV7_9BURK|nr:hypothetical protein B0G62_1294 [Paraburkholderia eburnea]PRZ14636.1 hypothetical protein BX588_1274 [Paraburkholderia eburnea]
MFNETVEAAHTRGYLSGEHFSVDGTLIQAWAGHKSFVRKNKSNDDTPDGGTRERENWHGEKRSNETHESSTDSQAKLFRKSRRTGALLCYIGHLLTDNRHGLVVNAQVTQASGTAERDAAAAMLAHAAQLAGVPITVGVVPAHSGGLQPHTYAYARGQSGVEAQIGEENGIRST